MANSNLTEMSMDSAGHPASALPIGSAPPTATFAARLAAVLTMSANQGIQPVAGPARRDATLRNQVEAGHEPDRSRP